MATNRKEHLRYRYGICLNDECPKCKSKEVQQITSRKDFVCAECQKPLRECPPPKSFWDKYGKIIIGTSVILVAVAIAICIILMPSKKSSDNEVIEPDKQQVEQLSEPKKEDLVQPKPKQPSIQVPFGTYSGPANGLDGEIRVTRSYYLDLRNAAHETLELRPGDVITRTKFKNGELVGGYWQRGSESRSFHR